jgi:predicted alpha/beta-fold hydrolase
LNLKIEPCLPPIWALNGHQQTLWAYGLPYQRIKKDFKRITIPLPDGDQLIGKFYDGDTSTLVVIFHGLIGSADSSYMIRMAGLAQKQGHAVLLMNHRGCGDGEGLAVGPYHSGRGDDISDVVSFCRSHFSKKQIVAMGFSLSANALLSLLTGLRGHDKPDQAIVVNGPSDLKASAESLQLGLNRLYDLWFVNGCRKDILRKQKQGLISSKIYLSPWGHLTDVDEVYTAPLGGFKNAQDYYAQCSTTRHLPNIKTPTFILMSKDDPFIPWQPYLSAKENPYVHLHLENTGGHMGYLSRTKNPWGYKRWMDETLDLVLREMTH